MLRPGPAALRLGRFADDAQPESCALGLGGPLVRAEELFEQPIAFFDRDPKAVVADADDQLVPTRFIRLHRTADVREPAERRSDRRT